MSEDYASALNSSFQGKGHIRVLGGRVAAVFSGSFSKIKSNPINIKIFPSGSPDFRKIHTAVRYGIPFELKGKTVEDEEIWIAKITPTSWSISLSSITATATAIAFGNFSKFTRKEKIVYVAYLPESLLVSPNPSLAYYTDGRIAPLPKEKFEFDKLEWETGFGLAKLTEHFDFYDDVPGIPTQLIRTLQSTLQVEINSSIFREPEEMLKQVDIKLQGSLNLLSLFNLKRMDSFQTEIKSSKTKSRPERRVLAYTKGWFGFGYETQKRYQSKLPVLPYRLRSGIFNVCYLNYLASPNKDAIDRSIHYLLASYEAGYMEALLTNVYSAIETLISAIPSHTIAYLFSKKDFNDLQEKLQATLRSAIKDDELYKKALPKLQEVKRRSLAEKIFLASLELGLDFSIILGGATDAKDFLASSIRRRNDLIHRGNLDQSAWENDFLILRKIAYFILLRLLGCPVEEINIHWLNDLRA